MLGILGVITLVYHLLQCVVETEELTLLLQNDAPTVVVDAGAEQK